MERHHNSIWGKERLCTQLIHFRALWRFDYRKIQRISLCSPTLTKLPQGLDLRVSVTGRQSPSDKLKDTPWCLHGVHLNQGPYIVSHQIPWLSSQTGVSISKTRQFAYVRRMPDLYAFRRGVLCLLWGGVTYIVVVLCSRELSHFIIQEPWETPLPVSTGASLGGIRVLNFCCTHTYHFCFLLVMCVCTCVCMFPLVDIGTCMRERPEISLSRCCLRARHLVLF